MSTIKADTVTAVAADTNLSLTGSGTGGVKVTDYLIHTKGADIASATALTLGKDGNAFDVTGTTTITSINTQGVGSHVTLQFDGILTFTHHSTDLILPGAANITTAAGDIAVMYEYSSGDWRCISYTVAATAPGGGGAWNVISSTVASDDATITMTGMADSSYHTYVIVGSDIVPATDDVYAWMRLGDSSGIDSGSSDYEWSSINFNPDNASVIALSSHTSGDSKIAIGGGQANFGNASGEGYNFTAWFRSPSGGTMFSNLHAQYHGIDPDVVNIHGTSSGYRKTSITMDRAQFLFASGNVSTGRFTLYGLAHA